VREPEKVKKKVKKKHATLIFHVCVGVGLFKVARWYLAHLMTPRR